MLKMIHMKNIAIICALIFLSCVGIVNGGTVGIMQVPGNGTSTTTPVIMLPQPTVAVNLTATATNTTSVTITPTNITATASLSLTVSPTIQYPGNITLKSQEHANIQNVSSSQSLIISINRTFPTEFYLDVPAPINLGRPNVTPPTLYRKVIEEDGTVVHVPLKRGEALKNLAIKKLENRLILESEGTVATTESILEITESGIYVGTGEGKTELKVLPDEASEIAEDIGIGGIENIELKEVDQMPVYELKGSKKGKLLAVIPVNMKIELHVNANTGTVVEKKEPWWSFLVKG